MRLIHHTRREGTRGVRTHVTLHDHQHLEMANGSFEGYIASGSHHTGLGLSFDEDRSGIQVFAGIAHIACGWVTVGSWRLCQRYGLKPRDWDIANLRFDDRALWWSLWHDKHSWHSRTPRWRHGWFHWWDWLTGRPVHRTEVVEGPVDVVVPMPEGVYKAIVTLERSSWKRPRWPWLQIHHGYDIEVISQPGPNGPHVPEAGDNGVRSPGYIPVPGKGENSWDCGGDGIFTMSGPGRTVEAAIAGIIESALRDRRRRGVPADYAEVIT